MDIWESNKMSQALTPHACTVDGQTRCEGKQCGDNAGGQRDAGVCDKDGCDWNPFRLGDRTFFGPGSNFTLDSTIPMTVVTQFVTVDGTDTGELKEIRRKYVQRGKEIAMTPVSVGGEIFDSVSDGFCNAQKTAFNDTNGFESRGGMKGLGDKMRGGKYACLYSCGIQIRVTIYGRVTLDSTPFLPSLGMVLVMSLWDDNAVDMLWLDSNYPLNKDPNAPGTHFNAN